MRLAAALALSAAAVFATPATAQQRPLRAVMNIELQVLDPIVTSATVTRAFGYMVYDTLVSMDSQGVFKPQMLEGWKVSDDRLTDRITVQNREMTVLEAIFKTTEHFALHTGQIMSATKRATSAPLGFTTHNRKAGA